MCIIIAKEKGKELNIEELKKSVEVAAKRNSHGGGFAIKREGSNEIEISKGYYYASVLLQHLLAKDDIKPNDELIVHLRYATAGDKGPIGCHPYVMSQDDDVIHTTEGMISESLFAHNGTFHDFKKINSNLSDTYWFNKEFLGKPGAAEALITLRDTNEYILDNVITFNKLAIMFPDKDMELLGEFIETENFKYSNWYFNNPHSGRHPMKDRTSNNSRQLSYAYGYDDGVNYEEFDEDDLDDLPTSQKVWNAEENKWEKIEDKDADLYENIGLLCVKKSDLKDTKREGMKHLEEVYKREPLAGFKSRHVID